jgi:hypothetical protein
MSVLKVLIKIFKKPVNLIFAIIVALFSFALSIILVNFRFIFEVIQNNSVDFLDKIIILSNLFTSINTSFTTLSAVNTTIISILFGINVVMIFYIHKNYPTTNKSGAFASAGGFISGIFGAGCASCGSFLLIPFLSLIGASWIVSFLPFGGAEVGFISIAIFIFAIFVFIKKIENPAVCKIKN